MEQGYRSGHTADNHGILRPGAQSVKESGPAGIGPARAATSTTGSGEPHAWSAPARILSTGRRSRRDPRELPVRDAPADLAQVRLAAILAPVIRVVRVERVAHLPSIFISSSRPVNCQRMSDMGICPALMNSSMNPLSVKLSPSWRARSAINRSI